MRGRKHIIRFADGLLFSIIWFSVVVATVGIFAVIVKFPISLPVLILSAAIIYAVGYFFGHDPIPEW